MEKKVFILWLLTISFWGVSPIFEKVALRSVEPFTALFIRTGICFAVMVFAFPFLVPDGFSTLIGLSLKDYTFLALSGIVGGILGKLTYFALLRIESASKIVPLTATYPLVATFLGILFLKESLTLEKILGAILVTSGIVLLFKS